MIWQTFREIGRFSAIDPASSLSDAPKNNRLRWLFRSDRRSISFILSLVIAVALPLAFNPWGYNGFALPKALLLRALLLMMALAALLQAVRFDRPQPLAAKRGPVQLPNWAALAFGLTLLWATLFSVNPHLSWWGSYWRQEGLLTWAAYLALFWLTLTSLTHRSQVAWLWRALVWGSGPVVAYGLLQAAGLDPFDWRTDAASPVLSTLGRANFLGSYLVLVTPLTLGRLCLSRRRWPYLWLLSVQLLCLVLTQARGAWLGFAVALVIFGLSWAFSTRNRWLGGATLLLAGLALGIVMLLNVSVEPVDSLARLPGLDRLTGLSDTTTGSTAARLTIWRTTLSLIAERPWFGYGPETMQPVFERVFPPQLVYYQGRQVVVDRAHNLWLDLAMSAGLAGVLTFAFMLVSLGRLAWRGLQNAPNRWSRAIWAGLGAGLGGHVVDLQVTFESIGTAPIFWLMLTLVVALHRIETSPVAPPRCPLSMPGLYRLHHLPALLALLVLLAVVGLVCGRPLLADGAYYQARSVRWSAPFERLAAARRAVQWWPLEAEYRVGLAGLEGQVGNLVVAEQQFNAANRLNPHHSRLWAARGDLYARRGEFEPAEMAYRRAISLAPTIAGYHTALGLVLARQGQLEAGVTEIERAIDLDTTDFVAYRHLAELYTALGREADATWARKEAAYWADKAD